jgi:hypothetical protein
VRGATIVQFVRVGCDGNHTAVAKSSDVQEKPVKSSVPAMAQMTQTTEYERQYQFGQQKGDRQRSDAFCNPQAVSGR